MSYSWRRNQLAVATAAFVGFTGFTLVMPFLPLFIRELGVTDVGEIAVWTGLTLGITPAITALCAPLWGRVGDRVGNKLLVQRALFSGGLAMMAIAFVTHVWQLFALRAALGFLAGFGSLTLAMAALSAPREKMAHAIGSVQTAQRMGPAFGPVIGGMLAPALGLRQAFIAAGSLYWVALVLVTFLYREPPRDGAIHQPREKKISLAAVLRLENIRLAMITIFGLQSVERSFGPVLALYIAQLGYVTQTAVLAGVLFSVLAFAGSFGNTIAGRLLSRAPPRSLIAGASLIAAAALAAFMIVNGVWMLAITIGIFGIGIGTAMTVAFAGAGATIPHDVRTTGFSFLTAASMLGVALAPVASGIVGSRSIRAVFIVGVTALAALGMSVYRFMIDRVPSPPEETSAAATVEGE